MPLGYWPRGHATPRSREVVTALHLEECPLQWEKLMTIHYSRLEPRFDDSPEFREGAQLVQQCVVVDAVERNGLTLPTSRAIRPRSLSSEPGTRWKARRCRCLAGCGVTASSI